MRITRTWQKRSRRKRCRRKPVILWLGIEILNLVRRRSRLAFRIYVAIWGLVLAQLRHGSSRFRRERARDAAHGAALSAGRAARREHGPRSARQGGSCAVVPGGAPFGR